MLIKVLKNTRFKLRNLLVQLFLNQVKMFFNTKINKSKMHQQTVQGDDVLEDLGKDAVVEQDDVDHVTEHHYELRLNKLIKFPLKLPANI